MTYQEIKQELSRASCLLSNGDVAGADAAIRAMCGHGLTGADLDANMTKQEIRVLRMHAAKK